MRPWLRGLARRQFAVDPDPVIDPEDHLIIRQTGGTTGDSSLHLAPISHGSGYLFTPIGLGGGRNVMVEKIDPAGLPESAHSQAPDKRRDCARLPVHGANDTERH